MHAWDMQVLKYFSRSNSIRTKGEFQESIWYATILPALHPLIWDAFRHKLILYMGMNYHFYPDFCSHFNGT